MNGVTIIAEHFCRDIDLNSLILTSIIFSIAVVAVLVIYRYAYKKSLEDNSTKNIIIFSSILVVVVYIFFWYIMINDYITTHMEYTVTIDDTATFNDVYSKYEIISVNGNEYRVIEK